MAIRDEAQRRRSLRGEAERGHVAAQTVLAQMLLDGADGPANPAEAVIWWRIAASAGFAPACNMLGRCLEKGWGVAPDPKQAAGWYERAIAGGEDWARYNLANMLLRGRGVPCDRLRAWTLFHEAAENGHAKSMNLVARFLEQGWDRPRAPAEAARWYRRSANAGDYRGRHNLAALLAEKGCVAEAFDWWQLALPDATPDILREMDTILSHFNLRPARALLEDVRSRLTEQAAAALAAHRRPGRAPFRSFPRFHRSGKPDHR